MACPGPAPAAGRRSPRPRRRRPGARAPRGPGSRRTSSRENTCLPSPTGPTSRISRKAALSGGSVGGATRQARAVITSVPNRTSLPTGASKALTRAVTLSSPWSCATRFGRLGPSARAGKATSARRAAASVAAERDAAPSPHPLPSPTGEGANTRRRRLMPPLPRASVGEGWGEGAAARSMPSCARSRLTSALDRHPAAAHPRRRSRRGPSRPGRRPPGRPARPAWRRPSRRRR